MFKLIFGLAAIALVLYLLYLLVVYVIIPVGTVVLGVMAGVGVLYAFGVSVYCLGKSIAMNRHPYEKYREKSLCAPSGVNRNYFFGPGFLQLWNIIKNTFVELFDKLMMTFGTISKYTFVFTIVASLCLIVFGLAWVTVFSAVLTAVLLVTMLVFFLMFSFLWGLDRAVLAAKSVQSRCGSCKRKSLVPVFYCPQCGLDHRRLTPGKYGVFKRKCSCGTRLPTTFLTGRSRLEATCPYCAVELAASGAKQLGLQLVGGVACGKTTFLATFWSLYKEKLAAAGVDFEQHPADDFAKLEEWRQSGTESTLDTNAMMYSLVHGGCQFTIYDIAGEAFSDLSNSVQQQQFQYCEGVLFIADPTAPPEAATDTLAKFVNEFKRLRGSHAAKMSDVPIAVVISKADLFPQIADCREFLYEHKFDSLLTLIDCEFTNVRFCAASALKSTGVTEAVMWLVKSVDPSFCKKIGVEI
jgi:GTPase SAR1 family protein